MPIIETQLEGSSPRITQICSSCGLTREHLLKDIVLGFVPLPGLPFPDSIVLPPCECPEKTTETILRTPLSNPSSHAIVVNYIAQALKKKGFVHPELKDFYKSESRLQMTAPLAEAQTEVRHGMGILGELPPKNAEVPVLEPTPSLVQEEAPAEIAPEA